MPTRLRTGPTSETTLEALFAPIADQPSLGLAVSGGVDSLALMILAHQWAQGCDSAPSLIVYTLDHGLRPEAAEEVAFVAGEAARLGLEVRTLRWEGDTPATGVQQAARQARYRLIGQQMLSDDCKVLATAHHRDDQAETILMRLARGSGLDGLQGMTAFSKVEGVRLFRPLLGIERRELERVVTEAGLRPVEDPSNFDDGYERVRWRAVMPQLAEMGLDASTLAKFGTRVEEANQALAEIAAAAFESVVVLDGFGAARFEHSDFVRLPSAIATRVLRRVLNIVGGRQKPRALGQIERLRDDLVAMGQANSTTALGCIVRFDGTRIVVAREPGRLSIPRFQLKPKSEVMWDDRFMIVNSSSDAAFSVGVVPHIERRKLNDFLGFKVTSPAEAIRTAPIVRDANDKILAMGGWSFDERVAVKLLID